MRVVMVKLRSFKLIDQGMAGQYVMVGFANQFIPRTSRDSWHRFVHKDVTPGQCRKGDSLIFLNICCAALAFQLPLQQWQQLTLEA